MNFEIEKNLIISAVRYQKKYLTFSGEHLVDEKETDRIELSRVGRETDESEKEYIKYANGNHIFKLYPELEDNKAVLNFSGEEGWGYEFKIPAVPEEAIFGAGEQFRKINLRGSGIIRNFVSEHVSIKALFQRASRPQKFYKEQKPEEIDSYAPMPVFVTSNRRLIWFDTMATGHFNFDDKWNTFYFDICPRKLTVLESDTFSNLMKLFSKLIPNKQTLPDWCYEGMIIAVQGGTRKGLKKALAMQRAGAKISAVWSQDWCGTKRSIFGKQVYWSWELDKKKYGDLKETIKLLNEHGIQFLAYNNPRLAIGSKYYDLYKEKGWLVKCKDDSIYHINSTVFYAGMIDLTNSEAFEYTKNVLFHNMLDLGIVGWMSDFGEYLPMDSVFCEGNPVELHNKWALLWAKINYEAIKESGKDAIYMVRAGYTGVQSYSPVFWTGDQFTDTTCDYGMGCVIPATLSLGFSGVPIVHSDIGGFWTMGLMLHRGRELNIRWMEMNTFSPLMRTHTTISPWLSSQFDRRNVKPYTIKLTRMHATMAPYIKQCVKEAACGIPVMRPDFWEANDYNAHHDEQAYFFGSDVFVAPVMKLHVREREVWLPEGKWIHFWSEKEYQGGKKYTVPAPLGEPPAFYKKGSAYTECFIKAVEESKNYQMV